MARGLTRPDWDSRVGTARRKPGVTVAHKPYGVGGVGSCVAVEFVAGLGLEGPGPFGVGPWLLQALAQWAKRRVLGRSCRPLRREKGRLPAAQGSCGPIPAMALEHAPQ